MGASVTDIRKTTLVSECLTNIKRRAFAQVHGRDQKEILCRQFCGNVTALISASDGRCAPARPALHVSTPLLSFLPCALASADCIRPVPLLRLL
jgi:hypothetical protein